MAIIVDDLVKYTIKHREGEPARYREWCHMMSDLPDREANLEELHAFAAKIGLKREWFQDSPRFPHYDLTPYKRVFAIRKGAVQVLSRDMVRIVRERDQKGT